MFGCGFTFWELWKSQPWLLDGWKQVWYRLVCVQVSFLGLEEHVENDPCKFVLSCRGSAERFTLQAANTDIKQVWVQHITELLDLQSNFLSGKTTHRYEYNNLSWAVESIGASVYSSAVSHRVSEGAQRLSVSEPKLLQRWANGSVQQQAQLHCVSRGRETLSVWTELHSSKANYLQRWSMPRLGQIPQGEDTAPLLTLNTCMLEFTVAHRKPYLNGVVFLRVVSVQEYLHDSYMSFGWQLIHRLHKSHHPTYS